MQDEIEIFGDVIQLGHQIFGLDNSIDLNPDHLRIALEIMKFRMHRDLLGEIVDKLDEIDNTLCSIDSSIKEK